MYQEVKKALENLIEQWGRNIVKKDKIQGYIEDVLAEYPSYKNISIILAKEGLLKTIVHENTVSQTELKSYVNQIVNKYGTDKLHTEETISVWADAMGVIIPNIQSSIKSNPTSKTQIKKISSDGKKQTKKNKILSIVILFVAIFSIKLYYIYEKHKKQKIEEEMNKIIVDMTKATDTTEFIHDKTPAVSSITLKQKSIKIWNPMIYRGKRSYTRICKSIIKDNLTGLVWQENGSKNKMDWKDAYFYCNELSLNGYHEWRLPTEKELYYLADRSRHNPSVDTDYLNLHSDWYWSSTKYQDSTRRRTVYFFDGGASNENAFNKNYAICVHESLN